MGAVTWQLVRGMACWGAAPASLASQAYTALPVLASICKGTGLATCQRKAKVRFRNSLLVHSPKQATMNNNRPDVIEVRQPYLDETGEHGCLLCAERKQYLKHFYRWLLAADGCLNLHGKSTKVSESHTLTPYRLPQLP